MERSKVELHGQSYTYRVAGRGPLIVLLHGMAGSSETWERVMPALAADHRVIAPDLIGHGESAKPGGDYSVGAYANLIRDLLERLGEARGTVVGHSLGGGVAMQFAYQYPERCERLVLVSSGGLGREIHAMLRAAVLPGAEFVLPWLSVAAARTIGTAVNTLGRFGFRESADLAETWRSFTSLEDPSARRAFLLTVRSIIDLRGQRVNATDKLYLSAGLPTLIIWGEQDPIIPVAHAHRAHEIIPESRLEVFPRAGHYPYLDDPERFAASVLDFIANTRPAEVNAGHLRARMQSGELLSHRPSAPASRQD
jgi:pimeloyl-ACP methyl ester carboxylesterase